MKSASLSVAAAQAGPHRQASASVPGIAAATARWGRFVALTKPRLTVFALITVAAGFVLGSGGLNRPLTLILTVVGAGLVAGGASAWNQLLERDRDRLMKRTMKRPLPQGAISPFECAVFGSTLTLAGTGLLAWSSNSLAALTALSTFLLYVFVYTPLKPLTTLNTAVGAIPGALPPVIGIAAATGRLGVEAFALFLILFLWQFPHFLAIAWLYRADYARAGYKMLPSIDPSGILTGRQAALHALILIPVGLLPSALRLAGAWHFAGALLLGLFYLSAAVQFWLTTNESTARRLLWTSFIHLPAILFLLLLDATPA